MAKQWWLLSFGKLEPVEVDRATPQSVWVGGHRLARSSWWQKYFPTWEDAHAYMLNEAEANVHALRLQLEQANGRLGNVKGMKPPTQEVSP